MTQFSGARSLLLTALFLALGPARVQAEEFSFDFEEFAKSPWTLDGYFQGSLDYLALNRDSPFYRLANPEKDGDAHRFQGGAELQMGLTFQEGPLTIQGLGKLEQAYNGFEWDGTALLYEGRFSWQINPNAFVTGGKVLPRWGKGYAWNPTNFVGRVKNPSDPDLSLEGHWIGQVDFLKSFDGALRNFALTGLVLPVTDDINDGFGETDHANVAGKLYLLFHDTDIDLMALSKGSRSARYGLTLSRNLTANFEIHGEAALFRDHTRRVLEEDGTVTVNSSDVSNYLAGLRYLAPTNTTFIFEYYHNGQGYTTREAADMFAHLGELDDPELAAIGSQLSGYQVPNFMRNYLYLKASQKEPFGWLYLTPSLFSIVNADDSSFNLIPEVVYTGVENLELRVRISLLFGGAGTEYGEKVNDWKLEFRGRYFF